VSRELRDDEQEEQDVDEGSLCVKDGTRRDLYAESDGGILDEDIESSVSKDAHEENWDDQEDLEVG